MDVACDISLYESCASRLGFMYYERDLNVDFDRLTSLNKMIQDDFCGLETFLTYWSLEWRNHRSPVDFRHQWKVLLGFDDSFVVNLDKLRTNAWVAVEFAV